MRYGTVVIVKDVGWFGELPDETVVKVKNESDVLAAVKSLVEDPSRIQEIGEAAKQYLRKNHSHKRYVHLINEMVG
jgi:spore maturation protein CgeB